MKATEDLQKGIQQLVDLTKQDDLASPNHLQLIVIILLLRKCLSLP
jgi:hypothetical protein